MHKRGRQQAKALESRRQRLASKDKWADYGTMEPDCAAAIKVGARQLGSLAGRTFLVRPGWKDPTD